MPVTPLHYPVAYGIYKFDKRLSLPGLIVGSMVPDLEVPVIVLLFGGRIPHHLVLHSLLGAATVGTIISFTLTRFAYPPLIGRLFRVKKSKVERNCRSSFNLFFSVFLGNISHVLLDLTSHAYNAVFWPLISDTPSPLSAFIGVQSASVLIHAIMGIIFLFLVLSNRNNLFESLLVG